MPARKPRPVTLRRVPEQSPRHPRHQAEAQRIEQMLARDAECRERDSKVAAGVALERPPESVFFMAKDRKAPDAQKIYVPAPPPDHPIAKARAKRKISEAQFWAANEYRLIVSSAFEWANGNDSTQAMMVNGGQVNYEAMLDAARGDASSRQDMKRIHAELGKESAAIVFLVCGNGFEVGMTVRKVTPKVHPNGVWGRFEEALDALCVALAPREEKQRA